METSLSKELMVQSLDPGEVYSPPWWKKKFIPTRKKYKVGRQSQCKRNRSLFSTMEDEDWNEHCKLFFKLRLLSPRTLKKMMLQALFIIILQLCCRSYYMLFMFSVLLQIKSGFLSLGKSGHLNYILWLNTPTWPWR